MYTKGYCESKIASLNRFDIVKLKSELLCLGLKVREDFIESLDYRFFEHDFIHGSQIMLEDDLVVNVAINDQFVIKYSPFELRKEQNEWFVFKQGSAVAKCRPLLMPQWVDIPLESSLRVGDIVRPHGENILFCTPVRKCIFETIDRKCRFCTFSESRDVKNYDDLVLVRKAFETVFSQQSNAYKEVALGGATPNLKDFGARYYSNVAKVIKEIRPNLEISLEIIPPLDLGLLHDIFYAGVNSIIMNIEVFDETIRKMICPGKSTLPNAHFFKAFEKALDIFGANRVSSVLIVGLEDKKSTVKGCQQMLEMGVIPTLIPFRPYDSCELNYLAPTPPEYYLDVYEKVLSRVGSMDVNPVRQPGCTRCGGCSLETSIMTVA